MVLRTGLLAMLIALLACRAVAQSDPPQQVQVPSGTSQGLLISKVQPTYPPLARQARVQGTVVLQAVIDKDGSIKDLTVTSGHPMLIQAAMDAVKQWRYRPYYLNGEPVLVRTTINVNFELSDGPSEPPAKEPAPSSSAGSEKPNPPQEEEDALKPYTTCDLGPDFQIVEVDGPVKDFAWPSPTKDGEVRIPVEVGYRVLITYMVEEPFGNLKVERLPKSQYSDAKADLLKGLQFLAAEPGMEPNVQTATRNGSTMYGTTQSKFQNGTLSIYYLFLEDEHVLISMYLLNAEPRWRLFNTLEEYKKVRDHFLDVYTKCVATAHESAAAKVGAPSGAQPKGVAVNSPASSSSPDPPKAQQVGQSAANDQPPGVYRVGGDVSPPRVTYSPDPRYSEEARAAHYEGAVVLWLVVDTVGLPQNIKVQTALGMGLDEEAIKAVKQWRFQPATKDGQPVPVMINVKVNFRLK